MPALEERVENCTLFCCTERADVKFCEFQETEDEQDDALSGMVHDGTVICAEGPATQAEPFQEVPAGQLITIEDHPLQLFPSLVFSLITPVASPPELLSAQARK